MSFTNETYKTYSFVECQIPTHNTGHPQEAAMFRKLTDLMHLRRATGFLLSRQDDRLLDDIGLTRADLQALHLGLDQPDDSRWPASFPAQRTHYERPGQKLPVSG